VYFSAMAACLHFIWKVKVVLGEPVYYAAILAVLLGFRLLWRLRTHGRYRPQTARA
jgi:methionine sulfoxide reductase heme-binding subunit